MCMCGFSLAVSHRCDLFQFTSIEVGLGKVLIMLMILTQNQLTFEAYSIFIQGDHQLNPDFSVNVSVSEI